MICHACGIEAPTKHVAFYQNIGMLVMRMSKSVQGELCKNCVHKYFWSLTGTTFFLGWWGTISLIITPFILLNNMVRYTLCLPMPAVPEGAEPPILTDNAIEKIKPHAGQLFKRLGDGESLEVAAGRTAILAGVSPTQVILFVRAVMEARKDDSE